MADGHHVGDDPPWFDDADRAAYARVEAAFAALARTVDPDDPWSHPDATALDEASVGDWLRAQGATPNVMRAREVAMLSLSAESVERTSLLADLRKEAAAGATRLLQLRGVGAPAGRGGVGDGGAERLRSSSANGSATRRRWRGSRSAADRVDRDGPAP